MTSATDELQRLLGERGVEWSASSDEIEHVTVTRWLSRGNSIAYVELNDGFVGYEARLIISGLSITPEQAIAATLGGTSIENAVKRIGRFCVDYVALWEHAKEIPTLGKEYGDCEWAESEMIRELAYDLATMGGGECEMVTSGTPCDGNTDKACTLCGAYNIGEYYDGQGHRAAPKFCPECGAKVKAVKQ